MKTYKRWRKERREYLERRHTWLAHREALHTGGPPTCPRCGLPLTPISEESQSVQLWGVSRHAHQFSLQRAFASDHVDGP
jgi:hypothetical protein